MAVLFIPLAEFCSGLMDLFLHSFYNKSVSVPVSASNVLKMVLNIIVSVDYTFVIFHSDKPTGSTNQLEARMRFVNYSPPWPARENIILNKKD